MYLRACINKLKAGGEPGIAPTLKGGDMVLNLDDDFLIDVDQIIAVIPQDRMIIVNGAVLTIERDEHMKAIQKAFKWSHSSYMYDKNLNKIKGGNK